jgi:uncharacterized protein YdcH (DUF465 family)
MTPEHHDLVHEFPEYKDAIHVLKTGNNHFRKLFDEYHALDKEIIRAEQEIETPSDAHMEELKKKRLKLKDELFGMLQKHAA